MIQKPTFGIDNLTHATATPVEFVQLAADAGASSVSLFLSPPPIGKGELEGLMQGRRAGAAGQSTLINDKNLQNETKIRLQSTGLSVKLIEALPITSEFSKDYVRRGLDVALHFGAPLIQTLIFDVEAQRAEENFAWLNSQVKSAGLRLSLELFAPSVICNLATAAAWAGKHDCHITLDTFHLERSGGGPEDVAAVARDIPGVFAYIQLDDGPRGLATDMKVCWEEATSARYAPGDGEMPLEAVIRAAGRGAVLSAEVPNAAVQQGRQTPQAHFAHIGARMRDLIARL